MISKFLIPLNKLQLLDHKSIIMNQLTKIKQKKKMYKCTYLHYNILLLPQLFFFETD